MKDRLEYILEYHIERNRKLLELMQQGISLEAIRDDERIPANMEDALRMISELEANLQRHLELKNQKL